MKWIKASERLPGHDNPIHCKIDGVPAMGNFYDFEGQIKFYVPRLASEDYSISKEQFEHLEWLDETPNEAGERR